MSDEHELDPAGELQGEDGGPVDDLMDPDDETEVPDTEVPDDGPAGIPQDMVQLLEETADLDDPVEVTAALDGSSYLLAGRAFAWAGGLAFEAYVGPDIAAAALRTPDVTPSPRGPGWIRLAPVAIDDHAADRVVAWFEMARRIAVGRQAPPPPGGRRS
jgi:hypothetical protein